MAGGNARRSSGLCLAACLLWMLAFIWPSAGDTAIAQASPSPPSGAVLFQTASECMACHNSSRRQAVKTSPLA